MEGETDKLRLPAFGELPWLVRTHGNSKHKQVQSFCSVSPSPNNTKAYLKSIPQLRGKKILVSHYGWFLLQDRNLLSILCLFNPVTLQVINLPPLPAGLNLEVCAGALSLSLDCDACVLLLCSNRDGLMVFCRPAQRDCSWVTQALVLQGEAVDIKQLEALNGVLYGTTYDDVYFCVEDDLNSLTLIPFQIREIDDVNIFSSGHVDFLLESCDRLYQVGIYVVFEEGLQPEGRISTVKVWELDLQQNSWVEVKCLNGRAFFLSHGDSTWCWGPMKPLDESIGGIGGNCIYFYIPDLAETLYMYNLLDQTWTMLSPCPSLVSPCDDLFWFIPQQQQQKQRLLTSEEWKIGIKDVDFPNQKVYPIECQELSQLQEAEDILSKLPFHIIEFVSNYMHLFEYWNFHASCKLLRAGLPKPHQRTNNDPLLMVFNDSDGLCKIMDPCRHDSRSKNILPLPLNPLTIEFSKDGWLLYLVGRKSLHFMNVLSSVKGDLPFPEDGDNHYQSIAFSTNPTYPECLIVAIYEWSDSLSFCYLRQGDKTWNVCDFNRHQPITFCASSSTPIFREGAFYYIGMRGYLGKFELVDGHPSWQVYEKPQIKDTKLFLSCLVKCDGNLYSVFVGKMGNWIEVFRFDYPKKCWVKIDYMKNYALFISRKSSFSIVTSDDRMRNKIFLPLLRGKDIVYYSLDTKKYHILGHDDVMENLLGLQEPRWCCWF